jgi:SAM-dependent methyltransferase
MTGSAASRSVGATEVEETAMGIYGERILPRVIDLACGMAPANPLRERVCGDLFGEVLEIGFGSGLNVPFYPATVRRVAAIEPSDLGWKLAGKRVAASPVQVERSGLDGQALELPDHSFDCALSTWTMCSIPDLQAALGEVRRVLRPGGTLHFVEHGLAPDASVASWQHRIEPIQKRLFGGCHLTRQIVDSVERAGFTIKEIDTFYEEGAPKVMGADSLGVATS